MNHKLFKVALATILVAGLTTPSRHADAGIPVVDATNFGQNLLIAIETVDQTLRQIQQFQLQFRQWDQQIKDALAPSFYIWARAQEVMDNLIYTVDTISRYENWLGSFDSYLAKFQDVNYYRSSPCFRPGGCTEAEKAAIEENQGLINANQKMVNDALFRVIRQQQVELGEDARRLKRLQEEAEHEGSGGREGQMRALGYANQFAGKQNAQLLQIRGMMLAQQNAFAVQSAREQDQKAKDLAMEKAMTGGTYRYSPPQSFSIGGKK